MYTNDQRVRQTGGESALWKQYIIIVGADIFFDYIFVVIVVGGGGEVVVSFVPKIPIL